MLIFFGRDRIMYRTNSNFRRRGRQTTADFYKWMRRIFMHELYHAIVAILIDIVTHVFILRREMQFLSDAQLENDGKELSDVCWRLAASAAFICQITCQHIWMNFCVFSQKLSLIDGWPEIRKLFLTSPIALIPSMVAWVRVHWRPNWIIRVHCSLKTFMKLQWNTLNFVDFLIGHPIVQQQSMNAVRDRGMCYMYSMFVIEVIWFVFFLVFA